ncbi:alpha-galactosidase [Butyrivibrio sp. LC3010]|uniref:alpha-galactosidase n=1 Tax=Butyrivibrio sp. LC3010 TaxID=1280680 RepID=UPI0003F68072|nr:alpha-galactosidase [Butyrivibrio sp. LC3010]
MNITYLKDSRSIKIDTANTSYVICIVDEEGFIGHAYYGAKLFDDDLSYLMRINENPMVPSVNGRDRSAFLDTFPTEFSGNNVGDFRESSIDIEDKNGTHGVQLLYKNHRIIKGKSKIEGLPATFADDEDAMTLEIEVEDTNIGLQGILSYSIFKDSDAITRSIKIKNVSENSLYLDKLMSMCLDMDDEDYRMLVLHGSWARERNIEYRKIGYGKQSCGSVRGESSHQEHPFIALVSDGITQSKGEAYGFNFVYSGNFLAQVEKNQFDSLRVVMGIHPDNFRFKLEPGDEFFSPEVVMVYSDKGLGQMTRTYHDLYRNHLIRSPYLRKPRPVLINNWEATYFDFDNEKLLDIARTAKKCGIEMLVMDDGWFGYRNDDNSSLGDWQVNENKLKGGLKKLVDDVNAIGLKFGIWFEPEMISPDSELYRAHPDWAIAIPDRTPCRSRNQYVLDLTRPEVRDYAYNCVASILKSANIEYVKWDMNRQLTDICSSCLDADRQGELMHRYVLGMYEMQERLITDFPDLLLENCSGGGARFDPGMLYYSPQLWCSDDTDAIERLTIQEGTALIYPLSTMGAHVSVCPNHTVGRVTPFETRGNVALAGTFGYELDVTKLSDEDKAAIPNQIDTYHKYSELIRNGDYYRLASYRENHFYDCYEVVSKDKSEALITFVQVLNQANSHSRRIKIEGLDDERVYRIEGTDKTFRGSTLKHAGLLIERPWGDFQSKLIHLI